MLPARLSVLEAEESGEAGREVGAHGESVDAEDGELEAAAAVAGRRCLGPCWLTECAAGLSRDLLLLAGLLLLHVRLLDGQLQGEMTGGDRGVQGKALEASPILLEAIGTPL